ncbi:sensor histidine kinase [Vannielia litorea]|uniref:sensor histidine kinase n=1 Tax=Vannielia litorea TaxID=1217970 RepID=UPI001BCFAC0F|nr:HAMP domain-containing sensor histidine kinase [Vannielia litorea]MBS8225935.1 sensor histidine kinase [Vannielia litorea]
MKDYAEVGRKLVWQRQIIFAAALALAGYYYSITLALMTGGLIALSEIYDFIVFQRILAWDGRDAAVARRLLNRLYVGTVLSASVIVFYSVSIALAQGPGTHFMSLFFLFAAALFAAMNNHHIVPILVVRIGMYGATFLLIPIYDIWVTGATIRSELWAQLFTSVFVLYFVIDCSHIYLSFYRRNLDQVEALKIENRKAQQAYNAKSEFISTMSHELRTPLTSIKGSIDLAHAGHLGAISEKAEQVMGIAKRNCTRLIELIDEILDLQKIEAGRMPFNMQRIDLRDLVEQSVDANAPYAARLGVRLAYDSDVDHLAVVGDPARIEQVLTNIISNAAKFSPEGSLVRVHLAVEGGRARVSVIDEGPGLADRDRERVFDKFSQVDSSDTRKIGGTGLGMNISKRIIQAHKGFIDYRKNEDTGTTFYFELDLADDQREAQPAELEAVAELTETGGTARECIAAS